MSGTLISDFSVSDVNLTNMMATLDQQRKGFFQLSVTNFDSSSLDEIAAGSVVDVDGALYSFDADEEITGLGSLSDGLVYIKIVPSGSTATAQWTNNSPVWDAGKQGWYGSGGMGNHRYVAKMIKSSSDYYNKTYMEDEEIFPRSETQLYTYQVTLGPAATDDVDITFTYAVGEIACLSWSGATAIQISAYTISDNVITVTFKNVTPTDFSGVTTFYDTLVLTIYEDLG